MRQVASEHVPAPVSTHRALHRRVRRGAGRGRRVLAGWKQPGRDTEPPREPFLRVALPHADVVVQPAGVARGQAFVPQGTGERRVRSKRLLRVHDALRLAAHAGAAAFLLRPDDLPDGRPERGQRVLPRVVRWHPDRHERVRELHVHGHRRRRSIRRGGQRGGVAVFPMRDTLRRISLEQGPDPSLRLVGK